MIALARLAATGALALAAPLAAAQPSPLDDAPRAEVAAGATGAGAEEDADVVLVTQPGKPGAGWRVTHRKTDTRVQGADTVRARVQTTAYRVRVRESGTDGSIVQWLPISETDSAPPDSLAAALADAPEDVLARLSRDGLLLAFDPEGAYQGIANIDDIARLVGVATASLDASLRGLPDASQAGMTALLARLQRPEVVEQMVGEPFTIFHNFHGYALTMGVRETFVDSVDVPLVGLRLPGEAMLETTRRSDDLVEVRYKRVLDPERVHSVVRAFAQGLISEPSPQAEEALRAAALTRTDDIRWRISARMGGVVEVDARTVVHGEHEGVPLLSVVTHRMRLSR